MPRAPWFKFYASDYFMDAEVDDLPLEAQAILVRMWCICWIEGELPSDLAKLARKLRIEHLHMQNHMQTLHKFFTKTEHGMLISPRMEHERKRSELLSTVRSHAAKMRTNNIVPAIAVANDVAKHNTNDITKTCLSESESDTDIRTNTKPSARKARSAPNPSEVSKGAAQTRHSRIHEMVMQAYLEQNGVECPWSGAEAAQLKRLLDSTPNWSDQQIAQCLMNLYASDGFPKGTPPKEFLTYLPKYLQGPLNQFKQSGAANGNGKARDRQKADIDAILTASARMAGQHNGKSEGEISRPADNGGNGPSVDGGLEGFDKAVRH